jgi:hypothetical protein
MPKTYHSIPALTSRPGPTHLNSLSRKKSKNGAQKPDSIHCHDASKVILGFCRGNFLQARNPWLHEFHFCVLMRPFAAEKILP